MAQEVDAVLVELEQLEELLIFHPCPVHDPQCQIVGI